MGRPAKTLTPETGSVGSNPTLSANSVLVNFQTIVSIVGTIDEDRYVVISADCHAGADLVDYRPFLDPKYHSEFDGWVDTYEVPYEDLKGPDGPRNWDSDRRLADMEADGIVAEVIFPHCSAVLSKEFADLSTTGCQYRRRRTSMGGPSGT
jgi:hypothetical protein